MRFHKAFYYLGTVSLLLTGCADESPWGSSDTYGEGKIRLNLESTTDVTSELPKMRSVSTDIVAPDLSLLQIRMTSEGGDYVKTWNSVSEFEEEKEFKAGSYILEAYFGNPQSQGILKTGDKGHEYSYYYGKTDVTVEPGKEANVHLRVKLANSVVVIEYTDAFKNYFTSWDTELITLGETSLKLGAEEGMCYVIPGDVDIVINASHQNGNSIKLNPASFEAEPQHLYKLTYNVYNGEIGKAEKLQVIFNDQPDEEHTIEVDLTDDLLSGEGPMIQTEGFRSEEEIETLSGSPFEGVIKFNVDSPDGYSEVILTISSDTYKADFLTNGAIDLCKTDASQQASLSAAGIKVYGLYNNPERLALVDMTDFCRYLPEGEHNISLRVKDRARVADASVKLITYPVSLEAFPASDAVFGRRYAEVKLAYNGADPTVAGSNPFSFKVKDDNGFVDSQIKSIAHAEGSRAFESKDYIYRISVPDSKLEEIPVEIYFNNGSTAIKTLTVPLVYPDYTVVYDPMATKVMMKLESVNDPEIDFTKADIQDLFFNRLRVFVDGKENNSLTKNNQTKVVTASGLAANNSTFQIKTSLAIEENKYPYSEEKTLNYEEQLPVPNGDFEDLEQTYSETMNQGGAWSTSSWDVLNYYNTSSFTISEAKGWSSSNIKTMSGSNKNTWFCQPSVFNTTLSYTGKCPGVGAGTGSQSDTPASYSGFKVHSGDNAIVIRNVAWDPNGTTPAKDNRGSGITGVKGTNEYYNTNIPDVANVSAGKIFIGEYPLSEQISDSKGVSFTSRPTSLTGWYTYDTPAEDNGLLEIIIYDEDKIIAQRKIDLSATEELVQFKIIFDEYEFNSRASRLCLFITSSKYASSSAEYETENITVSTFNSKIECYKYGATLVIDDLKFNYE